MSTLTLPQIEQINLIARLSKERSDYAIKQLLAQSDKEKAVFGSHVSTLDGMLTTLTGADKAA